MTRPVRPSAKRCIDVVVATIALAVCLPVLVAVAAAIWAADRGPILHRQWRVGRGGTRFLMWKFRSMVPDAESMLPALRDRNEASPPFFKMSNDPRLTPVGRLIRRVSLDELPQLVNVLRGEMSLVGPRPFLPGELQAAPHMFEARMRVAPGITGPWQLAGGALLTAEEGRCIDEAYAGNRSIALDMRVLVATVGHVARSAAGVSLRERRAHTWVRGIPLSRR